MNCKYLGVSSASWSHASFNDQTFWLQQSLSGVGTHRINRTRRTKTKKQTDIQQISLSHRQFVVLDLVCGYMWVFQNHAPKSYFWKTW